MKFGKWIGGGIGWALGGPLGGILGYFIGAAFDTKEQAIPNDGFYFAGWSDGVSNNPRIIEVGLSDIKLIAFFKPNPTLTISAEANGKVNTEINGRYSPSTPVLIIATPDSGLCFSQWSDSNYANTRTIIMGTNDLELTAQFGPRDTTTVDLGLKSGTGPVGFNQPRDS